MTTNATTAALHAGPGRRGRGRPRVGEAVADRDQLLTAALALIRAEGPGVTMDEIAAAAGVTKPIVYRKIGDKEALIAALSETFVDRMNAAVSASVVRGMGGRERFASSIRATFAVIGDDRNLFRFLTLGGPGTDAAQRLIDRSSSAMIEQLTASRIAAGLDPLPARTWAYAIVGAIQVTAVIWLRDDYSTGDDIAEHITDLMWPGVSHTDT